MKIILRDYAGNPNEIEIDDDVECIAGVILSGDMVMCYPYYYDTDNACRINAFEDGYFKVSRKNFEIMNKMEKSRDIAQLD
jgi:hypothetical protein